ncbi:MAG: hypothetical protein AB7G44_11170 [Bacteroidia bacterium]
MNSSKLITILKALTARELNAFEKLVDSPFFNVNEGVSALFAELKKHHPHFYEKETEMKVVYKMLFNGKRFDEKKLRYLMTDLTRLLEEFLVQKQFSENETLRKHLLMQSLNQRDLDKYFLQHMNDAYAFQEKSPYRDTIYYERQAMLEEDSYSWTSRKDNRAIDSSLQSLVDNIDIHYLTKKLKYSCEIINRMNVLKVQYNLSFLDNTLEFLKNNSFAHIPAITIYYQVLLTLRESENEQHYRKLKIYLAEYIGKFPNTELRDIYGFVQNYCIRQINLGNNNYLRELFENYKILLENEIIIENNNLAQFDFKNIVTIALRLDEYKWTEKFIEKYSPLLSADFRKNAINYNLARLFYSKKQYRDALRLLLEVEFTDVYYHLDSKSLLLRIYYELEDWEPLLSLFNTFKIYLKRNKLISEYQRTTYTNLVKFVRKLTRIKMGSKLPLENVIQEIEHVKQIADLTWLQSKAEELK